MSLGAELLRIMFLTLILAVVATFVPGLGDWVFWIGGGLAVLSVLAHIRQWAERVNKTLKWAEEKQEKERMADGKR